MVMVIADGLDVCMDCAALIANDEATDEHRAAVEEEMHHKDDSALLGMWVLTGTEDVDDTPFGIDPCDMCGSPLAGYRTKAAILL